MRDDLHSLANWKKHKLCLLSIHLQNVYPKGRRAYSLLLQTTMEPLPHGLLVLSSSKPLTGRTGLQAEGRFSFYWNHWRYSLNRNTPTTTGQGLVATTTCLVGYTPLRLQTLQDTQERDTSHDTSQETDFASHLVFASHLDIQDYSHQDYRTSRTTNHRGH